MVLYRGKMSLKTRDRTWWEPGGPSAGPRRRPRPARRHGGAPTRRTRRARASARAPPPRAAETTPATLRHGGVWRPARGPATRWPWAGDSRSRSRGSPVRDTPELMRLRLYHHRDGARVAYRETGTGPPLALFHSVGLSHREWEPIVDALEARFRVVLPDLPLHGDSEDRPRHPYTADWMVDVLAGFCEE